MRSINQTHRYLHGPGIDQIIADEDSSGEVHWALADNQNTVRHIIDSSGEVLNHITYNSFGLVTDETNPAFDFRFGYTGREIDEETGLYYYRSRYYDPNVDRFISEDTIGFAGGDANLYRYVGNSPTNFIDPDGQQACSPGAFLGIAGGAALADGPLPFGEAIAVGIGIWCLVDPPAPEPPKPLIFPEEPIDLDDFTPKPNEPYNPGLIPPFPNPEQEGVCSEPLPGFGEGLEQPSPLDWVFSIDDDVHPSTPVGHREKPIRVVPPFNQPTTINGRDYSGHSLDRIQEQGLTTSVVENTIQQGTSAPGNTPGTTRHYDPINNVTVITNNEGRVITVFQ